MGGFGYKSKNKYPPPTQLPSRKADSVLQVKTFPNQAFYYRLTGDRNPLHIDIKAAKKMNFKQPIIHGIAFFIQEWRLSEQLVEFSPKKF